jgi:uncharacterized membrane protein YfbV (UPF0208 family)
MGIHIGAPAEGYQPSDAISAAERVRLPAQASQIRTQGLPWLGRQAFVAPVPTRLEAWEMELATDTTTAVQQTSSQADTRRVSM